MQRIFYIILSSWDSIQHAQLLFIVAVFLSPLTKLSIISSLSLQHNMLDSVLISFFVLISLKGICSEVYYLRRERERRTFWNCLFSPPSAISLVFKVQKQGRWWWEEHEPVTSRQSGPDWGKMKKAKTSWRCLIRKGAGLPTQGGPPCLSLQIIGVLRLKKEVLG